MRTSEERVKELHRRMRCRKQERLDRRLRLTYAAVFAVCITAAVLFSLGVSRMPVEVTGAAAGGATASIFAVHGMLGYAVIAIFAFCLGAAATLLCYRLKQRGKHGEGKDDRDL